MFFSPNLQLWYNLAMFKMLTLVTSGSLPAWVAVTGPSHVVTGGII